MSESNLCTQCGSATCNGVHTCVNCGKNAPTPLMVDGDFYCDNYCLFNGQPNHSLLSGESESLAKKADIIGRMRALRLEAEEAKVTWIN